MIEDLEKSCVALDSLATAVTNAWTSDQTLCEGLGWHSPAITRQELASLARQLAADIRSADPQEVNEKVGALVKDLPRRLAILQANTVPQIFGGNAPQAVPAYISTIAFVRNAILPAIGWLEVSDQKAMPAALARRVRSFQAELNQLAPTLGPLAKQISDINSAHAVAESLPIDLQALAEVRDKTAKAANELSSLADKGRNASDAMASQLTRAREVTAEAEKLVSQCEAAYSITTTKGLAGAFDQRASKLSSSMWIWVLGLLVALVVGSFIGAQRLHALSGELASGDPKWGAIWMHAVLSVLSLGAPVWFAWLATKQIGQRFRLAEDYAFKASAAKAYEGYRREAARIDKDFEKRLFGSALSRLEEAPLRLVEQETHGSPWHEFVNSPGFQRALDIVPGLRDRVLGVAKGAPNATARTESDASTSTNISAPKAA